MIKHTVTLGKKPLLKYTLRFNVVKTNDGVKMVI